ncbi:MAG: single-stranded DNA-binding protein [Clostridia bacterium]|nr:single-stranded DNA-binding protein [Clostridia bacterium]
MPSLNKVILIGNITADPELKQTPTGVSVCSFSIGVSRRFKDANGTYPTDFINIVAWRQSAEFVCKYFRKGNPICIVGSIQVRNYTDQQGNKRYVTEVVADEVSFVSSKADSAPQNPAFAGMGETQQNIPAYGEGAPVGTAMPDTPKFEEISGDDDLPF